MSGADAGKASTTRPHDEFWVPNDWPGHSMALTLMRNPRMYRAECTCGWWIDTFELAEGKRVVKNHKQENGGTPWERRRIQKALEARGVTAIKRSG